jgi:Tfp pilus assembly protein PilF
VELWSETFDGTDGDIFALQEDIARQVATQLKVALNSGQQSRLIDVGTSDPDAYAVYLKATDVFNRRDNKRYEEAIAALEQALQRDPQFARAHSRLATLYYTQASSGPPDRFSGGLARSRESAENALRLNPALAEPHAVLGILHTGGRRYGEARAAYQRALELDPDDVTANFWSALLDCNTGHAARCESGLDRTLEIDPLLPNALNWRARLLVAQGDLASAERMTSRARGVGLQASWLVESRLAYARGDLAQARTRTRDMVRVLGVGLPPGAAEWIADGRMGDADARAKALQMVDEYLANAPARISVMIPWGLVMNGEIERGLATFADHPTSNDGAFLGDVVFTGLVPGVWTSPAFPRKTGLAAYWDEFGPPEQCRKDGNGDYRCE